MERREPSRRPVFRPALILFAALALGLPALAQRERGGEEGPPSKRIEAPADRNEVKATWKIGDQDRQITSGEFYDLHVLMTKLDASVRRAIPERAVMTHALLLSEAEALGLVVTPGEVSDFLQSDDPDIFEGVIARWKGQDVSVEEGREFTRQTLLIDKMKDLFLNTGRVTTRQAFDRFKQDRLKYKLEYVRFSADDCMAEVEAFPLDDLALQKFWSDNIMVQNQFRERATVTADIVFLDRDRLTLEEASAFSGGRAVSREDALAYFQANREELMRTFPAEKRYLIEVSDDTPLDKIVSPFSVLEESIKKRLLVEKVLEAAYEEAKKAGPEGDLAAIAERYSLGFTSVKDLDQARSTITLRPFGFNAWTTINGTAAGEVSPRILSEQNRNWFYLVRAKTATRLPRFDDIKEEVRKAFYARAAYDKARDRARLAKTALDKLVEDEIAVEKGRLEAEAEAEAERRVLENGITNQAEIQRERMKANNVARQAIEALRRDATPKHFDRWIEQQGLELRETPFFEFQTLRVNRNELEDLEAQRLSFFETNFYIRNLEPGQVTAILLDDPVTSSLYVARLAAKQDPPLDSMSAVDLAQAMSQEAAILQNRFLQRWQFHAIQRRTGLVVNK
ncbi:MAG: hypothetical protein R3F20_19675 [Planctomycetota bacterium]